MRKRRNKNKSIKVLVITLIILTVLGVLSQAENSLVSSGINLVSKGLFQLSAAATGEIGSQSNEELAAESASSNAFFIEGID